MINPKDLIETLSVEDLCQTADAYFKSIPDPIPQMGKPFSCLIEAPIMLQDMGHLLSGLRLGKTMTVLEFAAGTCWFSRYLNQLQCRTISCDVSATALEIGKQLFLKYPPIIGKLVSEPLFLHFDGHKINLPSESVDRIICFDGFHHVPNQDEVISELARVLKPGGIAGFSEPGRFHSQFSQSQSEMKNHKVLENDIVLPEIFTIALKHGFTDCKAKLLNDLEVSFDDYQSLDRSNPRSNPELESTLLADVRNLMIAKTIFFLYKGPFVPDSRSHIGLSHSISTEKSQFDIKVGEDLNLSIKISNTGEAIWLNDNINDIGVVKVGTHLYDEKGNLLNLNFSRHYFESSVKPGETLYKTITIKFTDAGVFKLSIDLVSEEICWFENIGSKPQFVTITVK